MKTQVKSETWQTDVLRFNLAKHGMSAPEYYEWHNGEALYQGEPIQGRACPSEQKAINDTLNMIERQRKDWAEYSYTMPRPIASEVAKDFFGPDSL